MKKRKLLVTGASGVLGQDALKKLSKNWEVISLTRIPRSGRKGVREVVCDLLDLPNLEKYFTENEPEAVLHLAASTHIDLCEADRRNGKDGIVWKTNVEVSRELGRLSARHRVPMVMLSTECVFDGEAERNDEEDIPHPRNWYGETKFRSEEKVLASGGEVKVLRSVIAFGSGSGKTIYEKLLEKLKVGKPFRVVADQHITPTYLPKISEAIEVLLNSSETGIFHISPQDAITPAEFAGMIARQFGIPAHIIQPITMEEFFGREKANLRLKNSCLSCKKTIKRLGLKPHSLQEAVALLGR